MMASRKAILDKNKQQLLDSVNLSNKIYTNEELSILLSEAQETIKAQSDKIDLLEKTVVENKKEVENQLKSTRQKTIVVNKLITEANKGTSKIVVNIGEKSAPISISVRLAGQYAYINYGGYAQYDMGAFISDGTCHGFGETLVKKGSMGSFMGGISTSCTKNSSGMGIVEMTLQFNGAHANGSNVYASVTIFDGYGYPSAATVTFQ